MALRDVEKLGKVGQAQRTPSGRYSRMSKFLWVSSLYLYDFLDGYVCSITVILVDYGPGRMNRWLDLSILNQVLIPIAISVLHRET